ncbi:hypothetical protein CDAR_27181 [Caerostris darwini]|uniref:Uncharacterized protein n=1 Tax=Caerostris darwini TaxID=1538125 RepID=A0AAV4TFR8_9ARAC|nr:hypothetical protein CDAR_27181 [Caerostris darwini]
MLEIWLVVVAKSSSRDPVRKSSISLSEAARRILFDTVWAAYGHIITHQMLLQSQGPVGPETVTDAVQDPRPLVKLKYKILESQSRDTVHKYPFNVKPP